MKIFRKSRNRINLESKLALIRLLRTFKNLKGQNQFLIFSDPRGGSTWLAEILESIPGTAIVWEPLNIKYVKPFSDLNFGWRQYIPENESWHEAYLVFNKVLTGKIINEWTMLKTDVQSYINASQFIIKFCRGNMLLPWLINQFIFRFSPVYLLRHPFAVVSSQLKQGGWDYPVKQFTIPDIPYNDIFLKHKKFLNSLSSKDEILTAYWCLSNQVPLNHKKNNIGWITVFYENLLLDPDAEIKRIFSRWNLELPDGIQKKYRVKSSTTVDSTKLQDPYEQLGRWQKDLKSVQLDRMIRVLDYFQINQYSSKDVTPQILLSD